MKYDNLILTSEDHTVINQLKISPKTRQLILEKYPEVIPDIVAYHDLPSFDNSQKIVSFAALIEGVTVLRYENNKEPYALPCSPDYSGDYSEYLINDEIVLMEFSGEVVIDRLTDSLNNEITQFLNQKK